MYIKVVIINVPAISALDYLVPVELEPEIRIGRVVGVPLNNYLDYGVVYSIHDQIPTMKLKEMLVLLPDMISISNAQMEFAKTMARKTFVPMSVLLEKMLPTRFTDRAEFMYKRTLKKAEKSSPAVLGLLGWIENHGEISEKKLAQQLGGDKLRDTLNLCVKEGWLERWAIFPKAISGQKLAKTALIRASRQRIENVASILGRIEPVRQRRLLALEFLAAEAIPTPIQWVAAASGCNLADLNKLEELGLVTLNEAPVFRDPIRNLIRNEDQQSVPAGVDSESWAKVAFQDIQEANNDADILLFKQDDESFLQLLEKIAGDALLHGGGCCVIVPETALTPRLVRRFIQHWPEQVGLYHGSLSAGEKYDTWMRVRNGELPLIIGSVSALYLPFTDLRWLVVDECQDVAYRNEFNDIPNVNYAAAQLAKEHNACMILASHTPPIDLYYRAQMGMRDEELQRLKAVGKVGQTHRQVLLEDMREELKHGNTGIFSRGLEKSIKESLERKEQVVLYHNRLGDYTYVLCKDCGNIFTCSRCGTTLFLENQKLVCKRCRHVEDFNRHCPNCAGNRFLMGGFGISTVERECRERFPNATSLVWGGTRSPDLEELSLSHFFAGNGDILIGTKSIARLGTLEKVTTIGVMLADNAIGKWDPFYNETNYAILESIYRLSENTPRVRIIIQTYDMADYFVEALKTADYLTFADSELKFRYEAQLPPFSKMVVLSKKGDDLAKLISEGYEATGCLRAALPDGQAEVLGPYTDLRPAGVAKAGVKIFLRNYPLTYQFLKQNLSGWRANTDPFQL